MNRQRIVAAIYFLAFLLVWPGAMVAVADVAGPDVADSAAPQAAAGGSIAPAPVSAAAAKPAAESRAVRKSAVRTVSRVSRLKSLARRDLEAGRFSDAYHRLRPNLGEARGETEYLALLALAALRIGSYGEALVIYERLTNVEPELGRWRVGLALAREQLGLDATGVYREALALTEGSEDLRALLRAKLAEGGDEDLG